MWPRLGASKLVDRWIIITLACSVVAAVDGGWLARWASLVPSEIWRGQVWRLVTWPLIEVGPMAIVTTCLVIHKFGGELAQFWGDRRLLRFMLQIVIAASVVTLLLATLTGTYVFRLGGWAIDDALVIAWARQYPTRAIQLYGLVTLSGRQLIGITIGITALYAVYVGPVAIAPELVACAAASLYPTALLRR
jgi:membrane associated rhomboid family serine protease